MAKGKDKSTDEGTQSSGMALKIALGMVATLALGAGGAYGAFAAGLIGVGKAGEPDIPKLVVKGADDPYAFPAKAEGSDAPATVFGEGGSQYRTAYYSFEESFTSNLAGSPALIQLELAVSTRRDGRVLQWVKTHEIAIRSAILAQLAATSEADVYDVAGKQRLAKRLTQTINTVLEENEGFGGIEAVHFRGFLVQ
ncbi:flagellar basal body-associated FliL family protein [Erythrobacter sp. T5W1-R]|uniref:flagellar basal body-associated FliL family protein n=1 Tax=Erythrobacter sp. T5W1-R TaxID=3101752 RepID=UPI002AFF038F|nr:flagellar basal body-associated FliL family protein [Erythrobacter sp. T5W1-R]MEA1618995.1 flagellar basal body-associated FliL family protein [Erythrobacter sp. T5W1-R]